MGAEQTERSSESGNSKKSRILKLLGLLLLLLVLVVFGFFVGIYLRIFDVHEINETMRLYNLPVIGEYFVRPPGQSTKAAEEESSSVTADKAEPAAKPQGSSNGQSPASQAKPQASKPIVLTQAEIEKEHKAQQAEEKKRVARLARLYGEMKPKAAADIMEALNDDITIAILQKMDDAQAAKILSEFDPDKSARLTRVMYMGITPNVTSPGDSGNEPLQPLTGSIQ